MELKRACTQCTFALADDLAGVSALAAPAAGARRLSGRLHLSGEHDLSPPAGHALPGIVVGSGYPVSSSRPGLVGPAALRAIAEWIVASSNFAVLEEFDGPFLVIAYREQSREIVAVRDKFGLRSAYYSIAGGELALADDVAALRRSWGGIRQPGLVEWMHYGAAMDPLSLFRNVRCLAAGSALVYSIDTGKYRVERYFSPEQTVSAKRHGELARLSLRELKQVSAEQLDQAVAHALHGQKAVSILLSGGVDSSLLTAFARRHALVSAVTVDIRGPHAESEVRYAADVARLLRVDLLTVPFGPRQFAESFCDNIHSLGTPLIIENAVALHYVAASGGLPQGQLVLDGEGADALMAGSTPLFKYSLVLFLLRQIPLLGRLPFRSALEAVRRLLDRMGVASQTTLDGKGLDVVLGARRAELELCEEKIARSLAHVEPREANEIARLMLREFYDYLVPIMLRIDRMCVAAHTHAVLPFFFGNVFGLFENIPMRHKVRWNWAQLRPVSKFLTKEMLAEHIPRGLVYRPKVGFGIPAWRWVKMPEAWRQDSWVAESFGLSRPALESWLRRNQNDRDLVYLASLEVWGRLFDRQIDFAEVKAQWLEGQASEARGVSGAAWLDTGQAAAGVAPPPLAAAACAAAETAEKAAAAADSQLPLGAVPAGNAPPPQVQ